MEYELIKHKICEIITSSDVLMKSFYESEINNIIIYHLFRNESGLVGGAGLFHELCIY